MLVIFYYLEGCKRHSIVLLSATSDIYKRPLQSLEVCPAKHLFLDGPFILH